MTGADLLNQLIPRVSAAGNQVWGALRSIDDFSQNYLTVGGKGYALGLTPTRLDQGSNLPPNGYAVRILFAYRLAGETPAFAQAAYLGPAVLEVMDPLWWMPGMSAVAEIVLPTAGEEDHVGDVVWIRHEFMVGLSSEVGESSIDLSGVDLSGVDVGAIQ
jgi:hypothetical protein